MAEDGTEHARAAPPPPAAEGQPPEAAAGTVAVPTVDDPQRPGGLATFLVFITSFFTSLVPQQRPDLQVN